MSDEPVRLTEDIPYVCKVLGISKNHGYLLIKRGEFPMPIIRLGNRRFVVSSAALRALLMTDENDETPAPQVGARGQGLDDKEAPHEQAATSQT